MSEILPSKLALLIDGDNAQAKYVEAIITEAGKHGKVTVKRIYGDWTDNKLSSWKNKVNQFSLRPMQKFAFASGKNSTDTAMIIDAMDILHSGLVSGFCIASSDSDYTGLVQRIKENGLFVMGIGEAKKTAPSFVNACDLFVYTENLLELASESTAPKATVLSGVTTTTTKTSDKSKEVAQTKLPVSKITQEPLDIEKLISAYEMVVDEAGFAYLGEIGLAIRKIDPSFDPRTYNSYSLTALFKKLPDYFELDYRDNGSSVYVKRKK